MMSTLATVAQGSHDDAAVNDAPEVSPLRVYLHSC
jgi:hypothetical protein